MTVAERRPAALDNPVRPVIKVAMHVQPLDIVNRIMMLLTTSAM